MLRKWRGLALVTGLVLLLSAVPPGAVSGVSAAADIEAASIARVAQSTEPSEAQGVRDGVFSDLRGHWAERYVTLLWARGAVAAGEFAPERSITRGEFARMLVEALGRNGGVAERLPAAFPDVDSHRPDATYIAQAVELGVVKGYEDGTFRPDVTISRAEMVTMLARVVGGDGEVLRPREPVPAAYADADTIPLWAVGSVERARSLGLVRGYEDGTFRPHARTTRAEAAVFIVRLLRVRATAYDFWGTVQAVGEGTLVLDLGVSTHAFPLAPDLQVFRNGVRVGLEGLQLLDEAGVIVDKRGLVAFVDAHLVAVAGTLQAVRPAGAVPGISLAGYSEGLPVLPGAMVFRQGRNAALSDLQPGDRIYALREWNSGWIRALLASRIDLEGTVTGHEGEALLVAGGEAVAGGQPVADGEPVAGDGMALQAARSVKPGAGVRVFLNGQAAAWADLAPGDAVSLARDGQGRVDYVEAWRHQEGWRHQEAGVPDAQGRSLVSEGRPPAESSLPAGWPKTVVEAAARERVTARLLASDTRGDDLVAAVEDAGGKVKFRWGEYVVAEMPGQALAGIGSRVRAAALDPPPAEPPPAEPALPAADAGAVDLALTREGEKAMGIDQFLASFPEGEEPTGRGMVVAIIDTGVDPAHPDLQRNPDGSPKVTDWVDLSGEGRVELTDEGQSSGGQLVSPLGTFQLGSLRSASGRYRWGFFRESALEADAPHGQDLDRNGRSGDAFPVFAVDVDKAGHYDTVVVDTDRDQDLGDEVQLRPVAAVAAAGKVAPVGWFGQRREGVAFAVSALDPGGNWVDLGFDGNGHGTHVAGTAVACSESGFRGVAPGASLMVLKALRSSGDGSWATIAQAMIYAAEHGAKVVGISAGGRGDGGWAGSPESELIAELAREYGVTFVLAAGNAGPGLGTAGPPGDGRTSLSVGAYVSPGMWREEFGYDVPQEGLWDFSGVGPRIDGTLAPEVVAPGSAASCVPLWHGAGGYSYMDGTSMAVPYVVGMLALMRQAVRDQGREVDAASWHRAVVQGARRLSGYEMVEQGYGLVDAASIWRKVEGFVAGSVPGDAPADVRASAYLDPGVRVVQTVPSHAEVDGGLYARQFRPGSIAASAVNLSDHVLDLGLTSSVDWIKPSRLRLLMVPVEERQLEIEYRPPTAPGLYTGEVVGRASTSPAGEFRFLSTVVVPFNLGRDGEGRPAPLSRSQSGSLAPARWQRSFYRVPAGATSFRVKVQVPKGQWGYLGRVRVHLYRPDGVRQVVTEYLGAGCSRAETTLQVSFPQAGVWELVVQSAPSLSYYGLDRSLYSVEASLGAVLVDPPELRVWVPPGSEEEVTLTVEANNRHGIFTGGLRGVGLARLGSTGVEGTTEALTATRGSGAVFELPAVDVGVVELWLRVGDIAPAGADLDLYLYYRDPQSGQWQEVGSSARAGAGDESITLALPVPGEYVAYVEVAGGAEAASFNLRYGLVQDRGQVQVEDIPSSRAEGASWRATVRIRVPSEEGLYTGELVVFDEQLGRSLAAVPIVVQRGFPRVVAQVVPRSLPATGGRVALHVRDASRLDAVDLRAEVNGQVFQVTDGEVLVPVHPRQELTYLDVALESTSYALWRARVVLPTAVSRAEGTSSSAQDSSSNAQGSSSRARGGSSNAQGGSSGAEGGFSHDDRRHAILAYLCRP